MGHLSTKTWSQRFLNGMLNRGANRTMAAQIMSFGGREWLTGFLFIFLMLVVMTCQNCFFNFGVKSVTAHLSWIPHRSTCAFVSLSVTNSLCLYLHLSASSTPSFCIGTNI